MITDVNGKGGGITVARKRAQPALCSILVFSFALRFVLANLFKPFSPALRITRSTSNVPITEPSADIATNKTHSPRRPLELTSAISSKSLPNGRKRKEESSVLKSSRPSGPKRWKKRKIKCAQGPARRANCIVVTCMWPMIGGTGLAWANVKAEDCSLVSIIQYRRAANPPPGPTPRATHKLNMREYSVSHERASNFHLFFNR